MPRENKAQEGSMIYLTLQNQLPRLASALRIMPTETGIYGDPTFRTAWLNLGQKAFCRDTKALRGNMYTGLTTIANVQEYDLWTIKNSDGSVAFGGIDDDSGGVVLNNRYIRYKTIKQLRAENGESFYNIPAGNPNNYYIRGKRYLGLAPMSPSTGYAGLPITVFYYKRPIDMVNPSDTPFDSNPYLEEYTLAPIFWAAKMLFWDAKQYIDSANYAKEYEILKERCKKDLATDEPEKMYLKPAINNSQR